MSLREVEQLVKSKQRVADHGEVFTPSWLARDMLDLVGDESARIEARVLEPACGSGNFLVPVLLRKLQSVEAKYKSSPFEKGHKALYALMCLYGIELLADNAEECRQNLAAAFIAYLDVGPDDQLATAARAVLESNIILGDALRMTTPDGRPISFPAWGYLGKGIFTRSDFDYRQLTHQASDTGNLFGQADPEKVFPPTNVHPKLKIQQIAESAGPI